MINLLDKRWNKYTYIGNDGIIDYIFKTLGISNGIFVEFGAWDGMKGCNCRKLVEEGWKGLFIESDPIRFHDLTGNYKDYTKVKLSNTIVGFDKDNLFDTIVDDNLSDIVNFTNIIEEKLPNKSNIDFCSIDIDGLDLEIFETFDKHFPTVICIEGGQMLDPYHKRIPKEIAQHNIQQSICVMENSFRKKGYRLLCTYQDSFFIKEEFFPLFNVSEILLFLYYEGLAAIPRRLPYIQYKLNAVGTLVSLRNIIVNNILTKTNYSKYGWNRRKEWAKKEYWNIVTRLGGKHEI